MPRHARLDTPGTLHHVIIRGIEKRKIADDKVDRDNFVSRMGQIASETNADSISIGREFWDSTG